MQLLGKHSVRRSKRGNSGREMFPATLSEKIYAEHFAAVDQNVRDSADYTTSISTNRFYFSIKFCGWTALFTSSMSLLAGWLGSNVALANIWNIWRKRGVQMSGWPRHRDLELCHQKEMDRSEWTTSQWMRQTGWLPCECGRCFCCLNGLTNWIGHRKKWTRTIFIQHDNTRTMTDNCTTKRVDLDRGCEHCKICLRKINANPTEEQMTMNGEQRKKAFNTSRLGCPSCDEHICKNCWDKGYDQHAK